MSAKKLLGFSGIEPVLNKIARTSQEIELFPAYDQMLETAHGANAAVTFFGNNISAGALTVNLTAPR